MYLNPGAFVNYYSISPGDAMKGSLTIELQNVTKSGLSYSKANEYKYVEVIIVYFEWNESVFIYSFQWGIIELGR